MGAGFEGETVDLDEMVSHDFIVRFVCLEEEGMVGVAVAER